MEKFNEHKPALHQTHTLQYWDAAIAPKELAAFQDLLKDMLRGEGRKGLKFERLKTINNVVLYSVRINQEARLLLTEQTTRFGERVLVAVALTHHYKGWEKNKVCAQKLAAYLQRLGFKPDSFDTLTAEAASAAEQEMLKASLIGEMPAAVTYFAGHFLKLTKDQERVSEISAPALLFGMPGTGKTVAGVEILRAYYEQNPKITLFFSSTLAPLVEEVKTTWSVQYPEKVVQFMPILQLLGQFCDMSMYADKTPCHLGEFKEYLSNLESAYTSALKKTPQKAKKPLLLTIDPGKSPEKAYTFLQLLAVYELYLSYENKKPKPPKELAEYIIKQCGFGKDTGLSIENLLSCLHDYRNYLSNKKYYDLGISTLPEYTDIPNADKEQSAEPENALLLDEVQHIPPALLLLLHKIFGRCILGIGDPNQALVAQPMELIWRTVFIQYEEAQLTQSLRCPAPVVRMTQSALALLQAIGGVQIKGLSGYQDVPQLEPNSLTPFFSNLPKNYSVKETGTLHIIVSRRDQLAMAEKVYGKITSFIHCLDDVGGRTFDNVLLVGFWEKTPWKMLTDNDYSNASAARAGNMSKTQDERLDIELWLRQFIVAISRCTKNLWLGQLPNNELAKRFLAYFGVQKPNVKSVKESEHIIESDNTTQTKSVFDFESFERAIKDFLLSPDGIPLAEQSIAREQKKRTLTREQDKRLIQLLNNAKTSFQQAMMLKPKFTNGQDRSQAIDKSHNNAQAWIGKAFKQLSTAGLDTLKALSVIEELKLTESSQLHALQAIASRDKNSTASKLLDLLVNNYAYVTLKNRSAKGETIPLWCTLLLNGAWPVENDEHFNSRLLQKILEKQPRNSADKRRVIQVIFCSPGDAFVRLIKQLPLYALQQQLKSFCGDWCRQSLQENPTGLYHFFMRFEPTTIGFSALRTFFSTLPLEYEVVSQLEKGLPTEQNKGIADAVFSLFERAKKPSNDVFIAFLKIQRFFPSWFKNESKFIALQKIIKEVFSQEEQYSLLEAEFLTFPELIQTKHIQDFLFSYLPKCSLNFRLNFIDALHPSSELLIPFSPLLAGKALRYFSEEFATLIRTPRLNFKDNNGLSTISWLFWVQECLGSHLKLVLDQETICALREFVKSLHSVLMGSAFAPDYKRKLLRELLVPVNVNGKKSLAPILRLLLPIIAQQQDASNMREAVSELLSIFKYFATEILSDQRLILDLWFSVLRDLDDSKYLTPSEQCIFEQRFYCQFPDDFWLSFFTKDHISYTNCLSVFSSAFYEKYLPVLFMDTAQWEIFLQNKAAIEQVNVFLSKLPAYILKALQENSNLHQILTEIMASQEQTLVLLDIKSLLLKYEESGPNSLFGRLILRIFLSEQYSDMLWTMLNISCVAPSVTTDQKYRHFAHAIWKALFTNLANNIGTQGAVCYVWQKLCDMIPHAPLSSETGHDLSESLRIKLLLAPWKPTDSSDNHDTTFAEYLDRLSQEDSTPILQKFEYDDFSKAQIEARTANMHRCHHALETLKNKLSSEKMPIKRNISSSEYSLFQSGIDPKASIQKPLEMGLSDIKPM